MQFPRLFDNALLIELFRGKVRHVIEVIEIDLEFTSCSDCLRMQIILQTTFPSEHRPAGYTRIDSCASALASARKGW